jgi:hypothetical protein
MLLSTFKSPHQNKNSNLDSDAVPCVRQLLTFEPADLFLFPAKTNRQKGQMYTHTTLNLSQESVSMYSISSYLHAKTIFVAQPLRDQIKSTRQGRLNKKKSYRRVNAIEKVEAN